MSGQIVINPVCEDTRKCFGAMFHGGMRFCRVLGSAYKADGECPFCKPEQFYTDGSYYPMNPTIKSDKPETRDRRKQKGGDGRCG